MDGVKWNIGPQRVRKLDFLSRIGRPIPWILMGAKMTLKHGHWKKLLQNLWSLNQGTFFRDRILGNPISVDGLVWRDESACFDVNIAPNFAKHDNFYRQKQNVQIYNTVQKTKRSNLQHSNNSFKTFDLWSKHHPNHLNIENVRMMCWQMFGWTNRFETVKMCCWPCNHMVWTVGFWFLVSNYFTSMFGNVQIMGSKMASPC